MPAFGVMNGSGIGCARVFTVCAPCCEATARQHQNVVFNFQSLRFSLETSEQHISMLSTFIMIARKTNNGGIMYEGLLDDH